MMNRMPPNAALVVVVLQLLIMNDGRMTAGCPHCGEVHVFRVRIRVR